MQIARSRLTEEARRAALLFTSFFLILLAYYHIKPASRSLFIASLGPDRLPYVWIASALVLGTIIGFYHRLIERYSRYAVIQGTLLLSIALLLMFDQLLRIDDARVSVAFYVFTDIFSVVLIEQMWSLTNSAYSTEEGKRWYGWVAAGAVTGGVAGGLVATALLQLVHVATRDLLLFACGFLGLVVLLNARMARAGLYARAGGERQRLQAAGVRALFSSRYIMLIALVLLCAQFAEPVIEYQFAKTLQAIYRETDAYTAAYSYYLAVVNGVALLVNLLVTPLVHGAAGVIAGLMVQPLVVACTSLGFCLAPTLPAAVAMKVGDRALSYSINRASKELLYVPIDPVQLYQAKAWIDMFGYRLFKVLGSVAIAALTQLGPVTLNVADLSLVTLPVAVIWLIAIAFVAGEYRALTLRVPVAVPG